MAHAWKTPYYQPLPRLPAPQGTVFSGMVDQALASLARRFKAAVPGFEAWRAKRAAYQELMSLDGHMLADIGLDRGEIHSVIYGDGLKETARASHEKAWQASHPAQKIRAA